MKLTVVVKAHLSQVRIFGPFLGYKINNKQVFIRWRQISAWNSLKQSGFTYNSCRPFTKRKERIIKFKKTAGSWYIYQNELDKTLINYCVINHLILLKIQNMIDIKELLLQLSIKILIKSLFHLQINLLPVLHWKIKLCQTKSYLKYFSKKYFY